MHLTLAFSGILDSLGYFWFHYEWHIVVKGLAAFSTYGILVETGILLAGTLTLGF